MMFNIAMMVTPVGRELDVMMSQMHLLGFKDAPLFFNGCSANRTILLTHVPNKMCQTAFI
jgi:hypothetical protein